MPDHIHNSREGNQPSMGRYHRLGSNHLHFDQTPLPWRWAMSRLNVEDWLCLGPTPFLLVGPVQRYSLNWNIKRTAAALALSCPLVLNPHKSRKNWLLQNPRICVSFSQLPSFVHYLLSLSLNSSNHSPPPRVKSIYFAHVLSLSKPAFKKVELIQSEWHNVFKNFHDPRIFAL